MTKSCTNCEHLIWDLWQSCYICELDEIRIEIPSDAADEGCRDWEEEV